MVFIDGIPVKKQFGQHFLRWQEVVDHMLAQVNLDGASVFEIGCGDGFLTKSLVKTKLARLWIFEIDPDWVKYIKKTISDKRMTVHETNILDVDWSMFEADKPWTLMANLPYQITFPLLHMLQKNRHYLKEGVIMVQEEVAEKLLKKEGRGYGFPSLYFQYFFEWKKLDKVPPAAFEPPPKIDSRLLYFKPKKDLPFVPNEAKFWEFIKLCFHQPRRMLGNNLKGTHLKIERLNQETLNLRAQQLSFDQLLEIWKTVQI